MNYDKKIGWKNWRKMERDGESFLESGEIFGDFSPFIAMVVDLGTEFCHLPLSTF